MAEDNNIQGQAKKPGRDRIGMILWLVYLGLLLASVLVIGKIVYFQFLWKPEPKIEAALTPRSVKRVLEPVRGNIIDCNGRLLAMSYPVYDLHMDCTVMKDAYSKMSDQAKGKQREQEWLDKAKELSASLSKAFPSKTADQYYKEIRSGRASGKKYLPIARGVDRRTMNAVKAFPLFKEGANKGGLIVEQRNVRKYPYGKLARRTIGFVRDNSSNVANTHIGLEGRYDAVLHGQDGREYLRVTDYGRVRDFDSTYVRAIDGQDLRTTINIDFQDIADRALREEISEEADLEGACLALMEVKTGAIRAMVNLSRDPFRENEFEEITNYIIGRKNEPGSVFKTVTLTACLDDGYIDSLGVMVPTNHGVVQKAKAIRDVHISDWERQYGVNEISVRDGFKISSNYVFATLALENYSKKPRTFIEKIYSFGLGESFDFDLDGLLTPTIPTPETRYWTNTDLGTMGFGYSTEETPLHILTFYNAIANKGRMMKPYLVEDVEEKGVVTDKRGPSILNSAICKPWVTDTVTTALKAVTEEGTARRLKTAKTQIAGKTGTSFATFDNGSYSDAGGARKYQGTFVGFFPADNPKYSVICCVYSKPTHHQYQGGGIPARAIKTLVDNIYDIDPHWRAEVHKGGEVPEMKAGYEVPAGGNTPTVKVPELKGLGLKDAMFLIENSGLECSYNGVGHVYRQSPAAGTTANRGGKVIIDLK